MITAPFTHFSPQPLHLTPRHQLKKEEETPPTPPRGCPPLHLITFPHSPTTHTPCQARLVTGGPLRLHVYPPHHKPAVLAALEADDTIALDPRQFQHVLMLLQVGSCGGGGGAAGEVLFWYFKYLF